MDKKISHTLKNLIFTTLIFLIAGSFSIAQKVPTPEEFLGFKIGADYHLASYQQAHEYFRALEKSSPMIKLFEVGKSSMGKPMFYAVITSAENMERLSRFKEISRKLALVKGLTDDEAHDLAAEGKAVVYIDGGLHATEVAPAQHNLQLAYDLLTSEDLDIRLIRDNTILVLFFPNPDGMDMVAEWYHSNLGTPFEVSRMPWLYHKYVGHDNNRDSYMLNQVETQHIARIINREWYPVILYNHHQTAPFPARIWIQPSGEPTNPNLHPMLLRGKQLIGANMGAAFEREKKTGAISRINFDLWYPGYVDAFGDFCNIISFMSETALYRYATPKFYTLNDFPEEFKDFTKSAYYPSPWKGGWWRLKDAVEYCLTASKAVLYTAAIYRGKFLYDKYWMGKDIIERFRKEPPYAWIITQDQWDPPTAAHLLNRMKMLGIEVYKVEQNFVCDGISYPTGTWVIPMDQPFALFAKTLFEEQRSYDLLKYPYAWQGLVRQQKFTGAYLPHQDMDGWTLPYQMGVKIASAKTPIDARLIPLDSVESQAGKVNKGAGYAYLISPKANNSFIAVNRILQKGGEILRARESFSVGGKSYVPGTYIVLSRSVSGSFISSLAKELFLTIGSTGGQVSSKTYKLKAPRVALYKSWTANMDEGWTRWLFEQYEFPFQNIYDGEVKAGELQKKFDVIVIPAMSSNAIIDGNKEGTVPQKYVGGITKAGLENIKSFVEEGGALVLLNSGSLFAIDNLDLPVIDVLKDVRASSRRTDEDAPTGASIPKFVCSGSVLRMEFDPTHPVAFGMPEEAPAMFIRSPAFGIQSSFEKEKSPQIIAKYPKESILMSGYLLGEKYLKNRASAVDIPLGEGRVILLGFGVQSRAQPHGTFKLLFNSLYYGTIQK